MIYVDDMMARFGRMKMSHLYSDSSLEELHEMAGKLFLKREWFQDKGRLPHYDVSMRVRLRAIELGARAVGFMSGENAEAIARARKLLGKIRSR